MGLGGICGIRFKKITTIEIMRIKAPQQIKSSNHSIIERVISKGDEVDYFPCA